MHLGAVRGTPGRNPWRDSLTTSAETSGVSKDGTARASRTHLVARRAGSCKAPHSDTGTHVRAPATSHRSLQHECQLALCNHESGLRIWWCCPAPQYGLLLSFVQGEVASAAHHTLVRFTCASRYRGSGLQTGPREPASASPACTSAPLDPCHTQADHPAL